MAKWSSSCWRLGSLSVFASLIERSLTENGVLDFVLFKDRKVTFRTACNMQMLSGLGLMLLACSNPIKT